MMGKEKEIPTTEKLDLSIYPKDEKGNLIVPDDILDSHYKELPNGTWNESRTYRVFNKGKLYQIGSNPEKDKAIHMAGAEASNATQAQRRTMAETIDLMLRQKASKDMIEKLGLPENATNQDAGIAAMMLAMVGGDTKAANFLRDTVGEKPIERREIDAQIMTENDRKLLEKVSKRLEEEE